MNGPGGRGSGACGGGRVSSGAERGAGRGAGGRRARARRRRARRARRARRRCAPASCAARRRRPRSRRGRTVRVVDLRPGGRGSRSGCGGAVAGVHQLCTANPRAPRALTQPARGATWKMGLSPSPPPYWRSIGAGPCEGRAPRAPSEAPDAGALPRREAARRGDWCTRRTKDGRGRRGGPIQTPAAAARPRPCRAAARRRPRRRAAPRPRGRPGGAGRRPGVWVGPSGACAADPGRKGDWGRAPRPPTSASVACACSWACEGRGAGPGQGRRRPPPGRASACVHAPHAPAACRCCPQAAGSSMLDSASDHLRGPVHFTCPAAKPHAPHAPGLRRPSQPRCGLHSPAAAVRRARALPTPSCRGAETGGQRVGQHGLTRPPVPQPSVIPGSCMAHGGRAPSPRPGRGPLGARPSQVGGRRPPRSLLGRLGARLAARDALRELAVGRGPRGVGRALRDALDGGQACRRAGRAWGRGRA
jgi:hypothetical protein